MIFQKINHTTPALYRMPPLLGLSLCKLACYNLILLEQLEKIEAGLVCINNDMQAAEKALKGMELCCGVFPKFWKK